MNNVPTLAVETAQETNAPTPTFTFNVKPTIVSGVTINTINARELHEQLGVGKDYSTWIKGRISKYEFVENQDFTILLPNIGEQNKHGGHNSKDYLISIDMAKELAMVENNDKGRAIRRYFIECERKLLQQPKIVEEVKPIPIDPNLDKQLELARIRQKELFAERVNSFLNRYSTLSQNSKQALEVLSLEKMVDEKLPYLLPQIVERFYTATELAKEFGVSPQKLGKISNILNLKNEEFSECRLSKSQHSDKQVAQYYYRENARTALRDYFNNM